MTFAFLAAGLIEAFLFLKGSYRGFSSRGVFKRTVKGAVIGPMLNPCSACIVPVSSALRRKGKGIDCTVAIVQGFATMNIPAFAMVFFIFTQLLGISRLLLALIGALLMGPIILLAASG